jgi:hypothetical protein
VERPHRRGPVQEFSYAVDDPAVQTRSDLFRCKEIMESPAVAAG